MDKKEQFKLREWLYEGKKNIKKAVYKRRIVRFLYLSIYMIILGIAVALAFIFLIQDGEFTSPSGVGLVIKLDQCTLLIRDHNSDISADIYVKYHIPKDLKFNSATVVDIDKNSNPQTFTVLNAFDPRYCLVELFLKESASLDSLQIECERCNITQDTSFQLEVSNSLNIVGNLIHANFRNLKVGNFDYEAISGYIQLSNIDSASATNRIVMNFEGDIIIQSTTDFTVDATTETQAFCFYAPSVTKQSNANCAILSNSPSKLF